MRRGSSASSNCTYSHLLTAAVSICKWITVLPFVIVFLFFQRVQTRAKTEGTSCRVALQISSNPNNEAKLTDLTIIMGVPDDVEGESLVTQPAGGVWNDARRCVTWCVEELAEGEKFQLQARFQMAQGAPYDKTGENPLFPVLVRCQCLFAQLSDLELEIREIPEIYPADVTMKIARRFRLSHRERA